MSLRINPDWVNDFRFKNGTTEEEKDNIITIVNQFRRHEIFNHNYNVKDIFNHIYKEGSNSQAKRQPNPFMIFRIVLGLIASRNNIKLGDGTLQSKIAGLMWGTASPVEKNGFTTLSARFRDLHKIKFPGYEYKPKARPQVTGFAENMTSRNFEPAPNRPPIPQEVSMHQLSEDNSDMVDLPLFDQAMQAMILNGSFPQLMQDPLQQSLYYHQLLPVDQFLISQQLNQLNQTQFSTLNTINMEKVDYSLQQQQQQQLTPSIALNCLDNSFDPNQPNYAFNSNHPFHL